MSYDPYDIVRAHLLTGLPSLSSMSVLATSASILLFSKALEDCDDEKRPS